MPTVMPERQTSASTDDVHGFNSIYTPGANDLILTSNPAWDATGIRWQNVTVPNGAIILDAQVAVHEFDSRKTITASVWGDDEDNCATFASLADLLARPLTTEVTRADEPPAWTNWGNIVFSNPGAPHNSDLIGIIQAIVNRPGWSSGNALAIIWKNNLAGGWNLGRCRSYDFAGNLHGPKLNITYTFPSGQVMIFS